MRNISQLTPVVTHTNKQYQELTQTFSIKNKILIVYIFLVPGCTSNSRQSTCAGSDPQIQKIVINNKENRSGVMEFPNKKKMY